MRTLTNILLTATLLIFSLGITELLLNAIYGKLSTPIKYNTAPLALNI